MPITDSRSHQQHHLHRMDPPPTPSDPTHPLKTPIRLFNSHHKTATPSSAVPQNNISNASNANNNNNSINNNNIALTNATHPGALSINTAAASSTSSLDATRTHSYWSGFYKKTIKERRTQLGLAFPHLTRPSSLESFASTQNSTKTSGQSTPNLGPVRSSIATQVLPSSSLSQPVPLSRSVSSISLQNNATVTALHPTSNGHASSTADTHQDRIRPHHERCHHHHHQQQESHIQQQTPQLEREEGSLLNYAEGAEQEAEVHGVQPKTASTATSLSMKEQEQGSELEREALARELAQGQEDETMTEEERRDQLENERRATVISNLEEQRKMVGSPNGHLLEGDLSLDARLDAILATEQEGAPFPVYGLDEQIANNMIENCIGILGLPLGLAFNFTINGTPMVIPMAIEEPSVIAAVSSAAKTISTYQGFQAWAPERNMIVAQVQILDIPDSEMDRVTTKLQEQEGVIQTEANEYCTNMVLRGGGVQRVSFHRIRRHVNRESFKGQDLLVKYGVISPQSVSARTSSGSMTTETTTASSPINQGRCSEWLVVHLHIDVGDAMGANCANTVAEGIAPFLAKLSGGRVGVRILSNLNIDRIAKSTFRLPFSHMAYKSVPGKEVAVRVLEAYEWADLDPYRAATHNKGIMNGIDAVALATGQDWRAIESGAHAWAGGAGTYSARSTDASSSSVETVVNGESRKSSVNGVNGINTHNSSTSGGKRKFGKDADQSHMIHRGDAYKPLTRYWVEEDAERLRQGFKGQDALVFCGELEMPIMVGTKGGVLSTNPVHAFTLGTMRYPDSKQLAMAMVTVGLAQNFAALRALVTEGIQRGHMALHARNIAISAGTPPASVDEVAAHMIDTGKIRWGAARSYIERRGLGFYSSAMQDHN
ncbi:hypothetical protein BG011_006620 [Mortierella polycephala]|uniref:hydroxymethylglutaryl-CoA reductase (NADPH) n=1 Tax=Mortierella polycephala TaxID=41804 RepID=A0A9P6PVJ5_9FUNG|nr:hypothetical protein BG011_006620 [Mortierella polycephala]